MGKIVQFIGTHIQVLTFIFSIIAYKKYSHTPIKILPIYLGIVAFVECFCFYYYKSGNVWLYTIVTYIQINTYLIIFIQYLKGLEFKIVFALMVFFNLFYILSLVFKLNNFFEESSSYGYVTGMITVLIVIILIFKEMLEMDNFKMITRNLLFWLAFSLLVFNATSIPLFSISNWGNVLGDFKINVYYLLFFTILTSHFILITGFLWSKKKYTY